MIDYHKYEKDLLLAELVDRVLKVTINRADRMNAVGGGTTIHDGLESLFAEINQDPRVFAMVLTGAGTKAFSAGGDMRGHAGAQTYMRETRPLGGMLTSAKRLIHNALNVQVPIVAAINGDATGFGATLALLCDITVMADTARIGDTHAKVGLVAGDGGALIWPFLIGMNRAKEFLMTGRLMSASEAGELGLVNSVVSQAEVVDCAMAMARDLAAGSPLAIRWTKAALNQHIWRQMVATGHLGLSVEALTWESDDNVEGARAFLEKRRPNYQGW